MRVQTGEAVAEKQSLEETVRDGLAAMAKGQRRGMIAAIQNVIDAQMALDAGDAPEVVCCPHQVAVDNPKPSACLRWADAPDIHTECRGHPAQEKGELVASGETATATTSFP